MFDCLKASTGLHTGLRPHRYRCLRCRRAVVLSRNTLTIRRLIFSRLLATITRRLPTWLTTIACTTRPSRPAVTAGVARRFRPARNVLPPPTPPAFVERAATRFDSEHYYQHSVNCIRSPCEPIYIYQHSPALRLIYCISLSSDP